MPVALPAIPFPIQRELVPPNAQTPLPVGFTSLTQIISRGLPHTIPLDQDLSLVVVVPTGVAVTWRDADPTSVVTQSTPETDPSADRVDAGGGRVRAPARLIVRSRAQGVLGSVPLAAGGLHLGLGARIDLLIRSWDLRAGSMRGAGDFGSRIDVAWRRADRGSDAFAPPPLNQTVVDRIIAANPYWNLQEAGR